MADIDITDMTGGGQPEAGGEAADESTPKPGVDIDIDDFTPSGGSGGEPGEPVPFSPPAGWGDEVTRTVETSTGEWITDYSAERLASYEQTGAVAWAVNDDGTETRVLWSEVTDPRVPPTTAVNEAYELANATNQYFWADSNGAHVSMDASDAYAERNILLNSFGMMLRKFGYYLVTMTQSAISFWDGMANAASSILASFGSNGVRIGRSNKPNTTIGDSGFSVCGGPEEKFGVKLHTVTQADGVFAKRRIYKVYSAGYSETGNLDPDLPEARVTLAPVDEPDIGLFYASSDYDGTEWHHAYSDGSISGVEYPLASVDEMIALSGTYMSGGDLSPTSDEWYMHETIFSDDLTKVSHFFRADAGNPVFFGGEFSPDELAQIPRDKWTSTALEHGSPNWFIGSVYDETYASLRLNGFYWDGRIYTADEEKAQTDKNITIDNTTNEVNANMLTASQVSSLLTDD